MTASVPPLLETLQQAADRAAAAETAFRRETARHVATLERERSFAFRRLNLMRMIAEAMANAKDEDGAILIAGATLYEELAWSGDTEARRAVLERFAPVVRVLFRGLAPEPPQNASDAVREALASFEDWYAQTHAGPFWALFDQYVTATPVVDF
jgi:hypothetical protein